jgi:hypothetical protein
MTFLNEDPMTGMYESSLMYDVIIIPSTGLSFKLSFCVS